MRYEVSHGKETFSVDVKEVGGSVYDVSVDGGESVRVDAFKTPHTTYSVLIGERQYEGSVHEADEGRLDVHLGLSAFDLHVVDERRKALIGSVAHSLSGTQEICAQMPGKIVKLLVEVGQQVDEDQGLVIIEAMKMENEIKSPIGGEVTRLAVAEGDTVETDALLVVVEPPEGD